VMKRYLQTILLFDVALPALFIGLPCCVLLWAVVQFQSFVIAKAEAHATYEAQNRQVATLNAELEPMQAKTQLLKALLSSTDIEAKLVSGLGAGLDKLSSDDIEQTRHDFQYGASTIGSNYGEGRTVTLKLFSRWESLNSVTADWETRFPNLVLESLAIDVVPGSAMSTPYLQSTLTYFVITEN
jgi:hypothetical protein